MRKVPRVKLQVYEASGQNRISYITKLEYNGLVHVWKSNALLSCS
ncbi:hypothetical protein VCHA43P277_60230 [Vibrio chagasii]|nr:hypothetical protein VCHA34P126_10870 [Vibrio chagasii]CAH7165249.1 hypothetical protein VCHA41O247_10872 [Vibrio chagasii]CAH7335009.1 hypothetical protein VCHA43P277_60230 [Vibrio chagasii]CAH7481190.1 hypothetical protein VCHA50P420_70230 [Vibrio chagasii]